MSVAAHSGGRTRVLIKIETFCEIPSGTYTDMNWMTEGPECPHRNGFRAFAGQEDVRIGAVSYLNSKPLVERLREFAGDAEVRLDYPSRLADDLAAGRLDVALIPSIEYFRQPGCEIVSDACVATHGPVMSVKLYSRVHPGEIRRLAVDEGSRTSVALSRVMLAERYGVEPELEKLPIGCDVSDVDSDAILIIGDRAMSSPTETFVESWDLGEEWLRWTGLPFVFAMWVARPNFDADPLSEALNRSRDAGVASLEPIAHREAPHLGISETLAFDYLLNNLHFRLGAAERLGLNLFYELASAQGLVPRGMDIVYRDYVVA